MAEAVVEALAVNGRMYHQGYIIHPLRSLRLRQQQPQVLVEIIPIWFLHIQQKQLEREQDKVNIILQCLLEE